MGGGRAPAFGAPLPTPPLYKFLESYQIYVVFSALKSVMLTAIYEHKDSNYNKVKEKKFPKLELRLFFSSILTYVYIQKLQ